MALGPRVPGGRGRACSPAVSRCWHCPPRPSRPGSLPGGFLLATGRGALGLKLGGDTILGGSAAPQAHPAVALCISSRLLPRGPCPTQLAAPSDPGCLSPPRSCCSSSRTCPQPTGATKTSACCWPRPTASSLSSRTPPITTRNEPGPTAVASPPRAAHPAAGRLKATAKERPCWSGWPGRGPGPGEGQAASVF